MLTKPDIRTIVAILGAVATLLQTIWPNDHWSTVTTAVITAVLVHLIPASATSSAPTSGR